MWRQENRRTGPLIPLGYAQGHGYPAGFAADCRLSYPWPHGEGGSATASRSVWSDLDDVVDWNRKWHAWIMASRLFRGLTRLYQKPRIQELQEFSFISCFWCNQIFTSMAKKKKIIIVPDFGIIDPHVLVQVTSRKEWDIGKQEGEVITGKNTPRTQKTFSLSYFQGEYVQ